MLRILIADDDAMDRRAILRALRDRAHTCETTEAASVEEMISACANHAFDCAIIDYSMPGQNGLEGIAALNQCAPNLPVIMITGQGDELVVREALKRGAADYIPKATLDAALLRRTIERVLEKAAYEGKLRRQRAELEGFARVLAHDLTAPLRSTSMLVSMIIEQLDLGETEEIREFCQKIEGLAQTMSRLIDDLGHYTRLDEQAAAESVDASEALGPVDS